MIQRISQWFKRINPKQIGEQLRVMLDIEKGCDKEQTVVNINNNNRVQGANAWMLMCSIMIASLGLDLNSPAVIIGAMLISPLMSPILGVGLSIGINDRNMLKTSIEHFLISVAIALSTSFLYFLLTPYEANATEEILSRTKPTFLDVLVAFFGGIAGIISGSRKDVSNAIPGVAIATALMPPLCVTGFGLANLLNENVPNALQITLNSFYLFFLNSTFIGIATYIIVRALRFPFAAFMNKEERKKTGYSVAIIGFLLIVPSIFIFRNVLNDLQLQRNISNYIHTVFEDEINYIDEYQSFKDSEDGDSYRLVIKVYGSIEKFSDKNYKQRLSEFNLHNMEVEILPSSNVDLSRLRQVEAQLDDVGAVLDQQLEDVRQTNKLKDSIIENLTKNVELMGGSNIISEQVLDELKTLYPDLISLGFASAFMKEFGDEKTSVEQDQPILFIQWKEAKSKKEKSDEEKRMKSFLETRLPVLEGLRIVSL